MGSVDVPDRINCGRDGRNLQYIVLKKIIKKSLKKLKKVIDNMAPLVLYSISLPAG